MNSPQSLSQWRQISSDGEERVVVGEHDERTSVEKGVLRISSRCQIDDQSLAQFKHELQETLVSCHYRIPLGLFEAIYQQRYKRPIDYQRFGANELEQLLDKVRDVVVLDKRKFLVAVDG